MEEPKNETKYGLEEQSTEGKKVNGMESVMEEEISINMDIDVLKEDNF